MQKWSVAGWESKAECVCLSGSASAPGVVLRAVVRAQQHGTQSKLLQSSRGFARRASRPRCRADRPEENRTRAVLQPQRSRPVFFWTGAAREFSDGARFRCRVRYQKVWLKNKQGTNTIVRTGGRKKVSKVLLAGDTRVKPASFVSLNQSRLRRAAPPALALSTRSSEASRNLQLWSIICLGLGLGLLGLGLGLG